LVYSGIKVLCDAAILRNQHCGRSFAVQVRAMKMNVSGQSLPQPLHVTDVEEISLCCSVALHRERIQPDELIQVMPILIHRCGNSHLTRATYMSAPHRAQLRPDPLFAASKINRNRAPAGSSSQFAAEWHVILSIREDLVILKQWMESGEYSYHPIGAPMLLQGAPGLIDKISRTRAFVCKRPRIAIHGINVVKRAPLVVVGAGNLAEQIGPCHEAGWRTIDC